MPPKNTTNCTSSSLHLFLQDEVAFTQPLSSCMGSVLITISEKVRYFHILYYKQLTKDQKYSVF